MHTFGEDTGKSQSIRLVQPVNTVEIAKLNVHGNLSGSTP
jgi:hypothetical protein